MESQKQHWKAGNMLYPIPAVLVSCQRPGEKPNAITVAWTGTVCTNPPMVYISLRPERYSYDIIRETGEFVINLTTEKMAKAVDYCGVRSGREVDKFREMQFTPEPSQIVKAPGILQCPVNIECRVVSVQELGSHHMFLAKVLQVNVEEALLEENGRLDLQRAGLLHYSHGEYFSQGSKLGSFGYSVRKRPKG
ncbi:MAG: flavin reductase family protein [Lachnospiraceae bacterium]|nr:flavin reductase family protein [Lachnospiraceae bacterium]